MNYSKTVFVMLSVAFFMTVDVYASQCDEDMEEEYSHGKRVIENPFEQRIRFLQGDESAQDARESTLDKTPPPLWVSQTPFIGY